MEEDIRQILIKFPQIYRTLSAMDEYSQDEFYAQMADYMEQEIDYWVQDEVETILGDPEELKKYQV